MNTTTFDKTTIYASTYKKSATPKFRFWAFVDPGMIRDAKMVDDVWNHHHTYHTGCPGSRYDCYYHQNGFAIQRFQKVNVIQAISPAWTTDWMTKQAKQKLKAYGIAPPIQQQVCKQELFVQDEAVQCPPPMAPHRISRVWEYSL